MQTLPCRADARGVFVRPGLGLQRTMIAGHVVTSGLGMRSDRLHIRLSILRRLGLDPHVTTGSSSAVAYDWWARSRWAARLTNHGPALLEAPYSIAAWVTSWQTRIPQRCINM